LRRSQVAQVDHVARGTELARGAPATAPVEVADVIVQSVRLHRHSSHRPSEKASRLLVQTPPTANGTPAVNGVGLASRLVDAFAADGRLLCSLSSCDCGTAPAARDEACLAHN